MKKIVLLFSSFILLALVLVPVKVHAATTSSLLPTANGNYSQFTPSAGSTHYALVDESACNGTTDYNSTTTVGNRDSYSISLSGVPNTATITQISITPCASRVNNGGTAPVMNVFYRLNGVNSADSGSYFLSGTTPLSLSATSFSGLSTVKDGSTALEIGAVLTSGAKGVRLSRIAAVITYTALAPTVVTNDATNIETAGSSSSATLNSTVNPNGASTTVNYRYDTVNTSCSSLSASTSGVVIGSGASNVSPNAKSVGSLSPSTTYYFCSVGVNSTGTTYGNVLSFTTLP